jgi:hypothetical protein
MDYDELFKLPTGTEDIESVFRTARGSTYAQHANSSTTRNRSGAKHRDTTTGIQPRSGKTVFLSEQDVNRLAGFFQNPDMATQIVPVMGQDGKPTGQLKVELLEDYGPRKAGSVLATAPYELRPKVGLAPMEIYASTSKMGDTGSGVHFGNSITEVHPRPSRLGKAGIAAVLAGGAGAASAGDLRRAAGDVAESLLPIGLTPSALAPGTLSPEQRAAQEDATRRMQAQQGAFPSREAPAREQERAARAKAQAMLRAVPMPDEYRKGGRVRMI